MFVFEVCGGESTLLERYIHSGRACRQRLLCLLFQRFWDGGRPATAVISRRVLFPTLSYRKHTMMCKVFISKLQCCGIKLVDYRFLAPAITTSC